MPRSAGAQPYSYLHPTLGGNCDVTNLSTVPARPFGFGLSYTRFDYSAFVADAVAPTDGAITAAVSVANAGDGRDAPPVVQLYGHVRRAPVTRPVAQLLGYLRVELDPGEVRLVRSASPPPGSRSPIATIGGSCTPARSTCGWATPRPDRRKARRRSPGPFTSFARTPRGGPRRRSPSLATRRTRGASARPRCSCRPRRGMSRRSGP